MRGHEGGDKTPAGKVGLAGGHWLKWGYLNSIGSPWVALCLHVEKGPVGTCWNGECGAIFLEVCGSLFVISWSGIDPLSMEVEVCLI